MAQIHRRVFLQQPKEDVYRGWVTWGPCVGESPEMRLSRQRKMLEGEWREAFHPDGRLYFYHTTTHEVRWTPPPSGLYERRRYALMQYIQQNPKLASQYLPTAAAEDKPSQIAATP